jgi:protein-tyrosine-phosphatase
MADAFLTTELATGGVDAVVTSAGTEGPAGRPASAESIEVMAEVGIDMTGHRSRVIDVAEIDGADLILTMTGAQERALGHDAGVRSGRAPGQVFVLDELARWLDAAESVAGSDEMGFARMLRVATSGRHSDADRCSSLASDDEIDDPYGRSTDRYRQTRDRLAVASVTIARAIAGSASA